MFNKKGALKNSAKFTGKHLCRGLFFNEVAAWRLWHRCFPVNFEKLFRTPFLQNTFKRLPLDFIELSIDHVIRNIPVIVFLKSLYGGVYSKPCQTFKMEFLCGNGKWLLAFNYFCEKLYLKCLLRFEIHASVTVIILLVLMSVLWKQAFNLLSAKPTKWSNTLNIT